MFECVVHVSASQDKQGNDLVNATSIYDSRCVTTNSVGFGSRTFAVHHISHLCMSRTEGQIAAGRSPKGLQSISSQAVSRRRACFFCILLHYVLQIQERDSEHVLKLVPVSHIYDVNALQQTIYFMYYLLPYMLEPYKLQHYTIHTLFLCS